MGKKVGWWRMVVLVVMCVGGAGAQAVPDSDTVWNDFMNWFRTASPAPSPVAGYAEKLRKSGLTPEGVDRRMKAVLEMLASRQDWIGIHFDKAFSQAPTGEPGRDGFNSRPSELVVRAVEGLPPGRALDAGMGQGRNAVYLARQGWSVTGFDISEGAVTAARSNAEAAGVRLTTARATYDAFDFGQNQWDLIVLAFAWAPVTDAAFFNRLESSLREGGMVVFEHFVQDETHPYPAPVRALRPGQLRSLFGDFTLTRYEETEGIGDWGGPGSRLVRMVARKTSRAPRIPREASAGPMAVPEGSCVPVVTDGIFSPGEWDDALMVSVSETVSLHLKSHRDVVFIGLRGNGPASIGPSELYLAIPGGEIHKLHVSAQLFEALSPGTAPDPKPRFGLTPDWYANELRRDMEEASRLQKEGKTPIEIMRATSYPCDGIEFAIRRSKFPGSTWLLRLWASAMLGDKPGMLAYPAAASETTTDGWLEIRLGVRESERSRTP